MTTVALIPGAGIIRKHARDRFSPTTTLREKSMPVAKHLSYARSRARTERSRRIHGPSCAQPRALPQQASSAQPAIAPVSVASRSILGTTAHFAESAGDILLTIASWMLRQFVAGCLAYAIAMYGIPEAALRGETGKPKPSAPPAPPRNPSRPTLHVILADREEDIGADEILPPPGAAQPSGARSTARSERTPDARSGWRAAMIAPVVLLWSEIREGSARHRMIAELRNLDDRSLRDIGISRADLGQIARYGVRPE
jgi:uncharacterized protein YjiS (DUF1127 family)